MPSKEQAEDKTGGTPDGGRMAPGAEGRGGARRQRAPEILAPLKGVMEKLFAQSEAVAKHMGHDTVLWRVELGGNSGQLRCIECDSRGGFALYPMRGKDQINGRLFEERCPR